MQLYALWHFCFLFLPIFPIVDVKCGGFCVAESSVPVRALPPSNIHAMCGAADLVLMVVRRCRCRALPRDLAPSGGADQRLHLGVPLHLGSSGLSPPSGTLGPPCHCTPLPAYQGTHIHSTVERLRFWGDGDEETLSLFCMAMKNNWETEIALHSNTIRCATYSDCTFVHICPTKVNFLGLKDFPWAKAIKRAGYFHSASQRKGR